MLENIHCPDFDDLAVLYAAGELSEQDCAAVDAHALSCAPCRSALARVLHFHAALRERTVAADQLDPSGLLLSQCRSELSESLDDQGAPPVEHGWRAWMQPARWTAPLRRTITFHPGWSAAALLLIGAFSGTWVRTWYRETSLPLPGKPVMTVSAAPRMSDQELETMGVEGIRWESQNAAGTPNVEVQLRTERPVVVQGSADDSEIRRVLTYVVEHGQRFDPGVRLDSLDVLRTRTGDPRVRAALCQAVLRDPNPAVRLKALDALHSLGADPAVQAAMLGALSEDGNSGVRIEALGGLLAALDNADGPSISLNHQALGVLRDRMQNDSNNYVRWRSASVLSRMASWDADSPTASRARRRP